MKDVLYVDAECRFVELKEKNIFEMGNNVVLFLYTYGYDYVYRIRTIFILAT